MRNRAKCGLCKEALESFTEFDYVTCKCGEISICGGNLRLETSAKDYKNFIRLEEDGSEIPVKFVTDHTDEIEAGAEEEIPLKLDAAQKGKLIDDMLSYYDRMPAHAMTSPANQYDMKAVFLLMKQLLPD